MTTLVLLHSPLVGPVTWQPVAARLGAVAPDLRDTGGDPSLIADRLRAIEGPKVLAGHSGAGRLLPAIAASLGDVERLIYVDAEPPHPGLSWWDTAPADLVTHLRGMERDGFLPPWHEWFPPGELDAVLPDPELRAAVVAELGPVPVSFFDRPAPDVTWAGPVGFLLLSEGYRVAAEQVRSDGGTVVEALDHHLAILTDPGRTAQLLRQMSNG